VSLVVPPSPPPKTNLDLKKAFHVLSMAAFKAVSCNLHAFLGILEKARILQLQERPRDVQAEKAIVVDQIEDGLGAVGCTGVTHKQGKVQRNVKFLLSPFRESSVSLEEQLQSLVPGSTVHEDPRLFVQRHAEDKVAVVVFGKLHPLPGLVEQLHIRLFLVFRTTITPFREILCREFQVS
jgi:hypothetical protein